MAFGGANAAAGAVAEFSTELGVLGNQSQGSGEGWKMECCHGIATDCGAINCGNGDHHIQHHHQQLSKGMVKMLRLVAADECLALKS